MGRGRSAHGEPWPWGELVPAVAAAKRRSMAGLTQGTPRGLRPIVKGRVVELNPAGQEPRQGNAPGRAVKLGEPGGRLAEELKVRQVSACAQGGKGPVGFISWYYLDCSFD